MNEDDFRRLENAVNEVQVVIALLLVVLAAGAVLVAVLR